MNSAVIGHLGSAATAANSVAQVTRQLATVVAFGIANAAAIMIGKAIGAGDVERAKNYGARFTKLTLLAGVAGAVVVLIVRPIVMASMTLSPEAEGYLSMMMLVMSYFVIGQAYNTTMVVGVFRAGGDTRFGLALDVISKVVLLHSLGCNRGLCAEVERTGRLYHTDERRGPQGSVYHLAL